MHDECGDDGSLPHATPAQPAWCSQLFGQAVLPKPLNEQAKRYGHATGRAQWAHDHLSMMLRSGLVEAGNRLPSERDLASLLCVARGTVRDALMRLRTDVLPHHLHAKPQISGAAAAAVPGDEPCSNPAVSAADRASLKALRDRMAEGWPRDLLLKQAPPGNLDRLQALLANWHLAPCRAGSVLKLILAHEWMVDCLSKESHAALAQRFHAASAPALVAAVRVLGEAGAVCSARAVLTALAAGDSSEASAALREHLCALTSSFEHHK